MFDLQCALYSLLFSSLRFKSERETKRKKEAKNIRHNKSGRVLQFVRYLFSIASYWSYRREANRLKGTEARRQSCAIRSFASVDAPLEKAERCQVCDVRTRYNAVQCGTRRSAAKYLTPPFKSSNSLNVYTSAKNRHTNVKQTPFFPTSRAAHAHTLDALRV